MHARDLRLYLPDTTLGGDTSPMVVLRYGAEILDAPNTLDASNLVHRVLVQGEGSTRRELPQTPGTPAPWGPMEAYVEQGGVSDDATLEVLADAALKAGAQPSAQYTRTISLANVAAGSVPLINYGPGAYITAPGSTGALERLRVKEIALTMDTNGLRAVLVLNDRMTEATIKLAKRQAGLLGGAIVSVSYTHLTLPTKRIV